MLCVFTLSFLNEQNWAFPSCRALSCRQRCVGPVRQGHAHRRSFIALRCRGSAGTHINVSLGYDLHSQAVLRASGHAAEGDLLSLRPTLYPQCLKRDEGLTSKQTVPHLTTLPPLLEI